VLGLLGISATFSPLMADTSLWWQKRRGIAVAICGERQLPRRRDLAAIVQHVVETSGWRTAYFGMGVLCALAMTTLAMFLHRRPPEAAAPAPFAPGTGTDRPFGLSPGAAQALLMVAGVACCVAMAMPQVHIVAYCGDLGYGAARGAEMLSLMLACGIVSRLVSGWICDHIGGLRTLLLGSVLQGHRAAALPALHRARPALRHLRRSSASSRAASCPRTRSSCASTSPRARRARASAPSSCARSSAWPWAAGCRQVFDLTGSYQAAFLNGIA